MRFRSTVDTVQEHLCDAPDQLENKTKDSVSGGSEFFFDASFFFFLWFVTLTMK